MALARAGVGLFKVCTAGTRRIEKLPPRASARWLQKSPPWIDGIDSENKLQDSLANVKRLLAEAKGNFCAFAL
jgi:hypothetical protein